MKPQTFFGLWMGLTITACSSSSYLFHADPTGTSVFYIDEKTQAKQLLGVTPINFSKSSLPTESPFLLSFEKEGFITQQVPVAPSNDARTTVAVTLRMDPVAEKQPNAEMNKYINRILGVQNLIYKKRIQSAIIELDQIIRDKPDIIQAHIMRGTCYYILNEVSTAIESWKTALTLDPGNKELLNFLAQKNIVVKGK